MMAASSSKSSKYVFYFIVVIIIGIQIPNLGVADYFKCIKVIKLSTNKTFKPTKSPQLCVLFTRKASVVGVSQEREQNMGAEIKRY